MNENEKQMTEEESLLIITGMINREHRLLLIGAAVIAAWIIPGYLLRVKFNKENY